MSPKPSGGASEELSSSSLSGLHAPSCGLADVIPVGLGDTSPGKPAPWPVSAFPGVCQRRIAEAAKNAASKFENPETTMLIIAQRRVPLSPLPREIQVKKKTLLTNYVISK